MPRTTKPLTNTEINRAKPREKEFNLSDGAGLYLRIKPSGTKSWLFNFIKPHTKIRTNMSFGSYPAVSLAEARAKQRECAALLAKEIDPKQHREVAALAIETAKLNTFEHVAFDWLERKREEVTFDYALDIERALKNHVFPKLASVPISEITAPMAIECLNPLQISGKFETIRRLIQSMNRIMLFGVNTGLIPYNPLAGIQAAFSKPQRKHQVTIAPSELPELTEAISRASITETTRNLILWQLHTLTRPSEAAGARWDEIDIEHKLWTIPGSRMKRGKDHKIPLSDEAMAILERIRPESSYREHLFPSKKNPRKSTHSQTANMALKRMGYANKLVAHGLRALGSTTLNEQGFHSDLIEKALSHAEPNAVRAAYNHAELLEGRREMMQWWSDHIIQSSTEVS